MATTELQSQSQSFFARFARDQRGVVALAGLAMAVFLTGIVYYEIGVGDAITFKEQLQDASDASGFAAAVYHAKGMNMIVLVNLIMAAVLAIIVILRVLELVFGLVTALVLATCWIPGFEWLCPVAPIASDAMEWAATTATELDPVVRTALMGLNDVATVIAVGMPWVGLIKSGTVGAQYYPQVTSKVGGGTVMLSMSLIPDMSWIPAVNSAGQSAGSSVTGPLGLGGSEEPGQSKVEGKRWGLPVQEGEFNVLCAQAAMALPDLLEWAINAAVHHKQADPKPPKWLSWLNNAIGAAIGSWPQYFCDQDSLTSGQVASQVQQQAQTQCNANAQEWKECSNLVLLGQLPFSGNPSPVASPDPTTTGPCANGVGAEVEKANGKAFDMDACMKEQTEKINNAAAEANNSSAWNSAKNSVLPKAIYSYAANGNDYLAVWSFGWGRFNDNEESGVSIAKWSKSGLAAPKPSQETMLTKAEFFYAVENPCKSDDGKQDFGTKGSSALCNTPLNMPFWGDYQGDVMWNPRWKARLRRVSPPMIPIGQMASAGLESLAGAALKKGIGMIPGGEGQADGAGAGTAIEFITSWLQIGGGMADGAIAGQIEKAAGYLH